MHSSASASGLRPRTRMSSVLTECDAWDIALMWCDQLRGCVRLEMDSKEIQSSIMPTFGWVTFVFRGRLHDIPPELDGSLKTAACARAATIAWFALSCCQGYSSAENPQFWKRVFCELKDPLVFNTRDAVSPYPPHSSIADVIHFFEHPDRPFPRIKLPLGSLKDDAAVASVFLGRLSYEDGERDAKLQRILTKLQPYMRKSDAMRSVPVELEVWDYPMACEIFEPDEAECLSEVSSGEGSQPHASVPMRYLVNSFPLQRYSLQFLDNSTLDIRSLHSLMMPSNVLEGGRLSSFAQDHQLWRGLLDQLRNDSCVEDDCRGIVNHADIMQNDDLVHPCFSALCSALPHVQSVRLLKLPNLRSFNEAPTFVASDWAWLGYAIFHPDASTSGLRNLEVVMNGSPIDCAPLARMAVGNNLVRDTNTGYLEGLIRSGTEVRTSQGSEDKPILYTFKAESWVSMVTPATEAVNREVCVCVVIPGFRAGWVRRENIIETRTRRAGGSCIRALLVRVITRDVNEEALLGLLRVLGSRLTSLHFENSNHMSASIVHAILCLCPSLKSLRIHHDGSFWADEALAMAMPRLEELELTVHGQYSTLKQTCAYLAYCLSYRRRSDPPPRDAWETEPLRQLQELKPSCLPHLKALHVISARDGAYEQHEAVLVSFLSKQPVLQQLHWSQGCKTSRKWEEAPEYYRNEATPTFLAQLPASYHLSLGPLHANCRLAFLSVIDDKAAQTSVGQLTKDVVMLIFQYSSSPTVREIFINRFAPL